MPTLDTIQSYFYVRNMWGLPTINVKRLEQSARLDYYYYYHCLMYVRHSSLGRLEPFIQNYYRLNRSHCNFRLTGGTTWKLRHSRLLQSMPLQWPLTIPWEVEISQANSFIRPCGDLKPRNMDKRVWLAVLDQLSPGAMFRALAQDWKLLGRNSLRDSRSLDFAQCTGRKPLSTCFWKHVKVSY